MCLNHSQVCQDVLLRRLDLLLTAVFACYCYHVLLCLYVIEILVVGFVILVSLDDLIPTQGTTVLILPTLAAQDAVGLDVECPLAWPPPVAGGPSIVAEGVQSALLGRWATELPA